MNTMRISVEGNIGSGKSSALGSLALRGYRVREEPVDEWGDLLDLYYQNPAQWSLAFNLKVLHSFHNTGDATVIERSPGACRHVFGQLAYNDNHLSPGAWDVFKEYHELLGWEPDAYVYIDTPPAECFTRLTKRGRECESGVTEDYLRRIEFQYQNFLKFTKVPVYTIDGMQEPWKIVRDIELLLVKM